MFVAARRYLVLVGLLAGGLIAGPATQAQSLSADPVFALNTQSHTGITLRLAVTPDERRLVTAGFDKTVRVWDVATGEQLRRFFLPVRDGLDGAIEAMALSPDGERLALGGGIFGLGKGRSIVVMSMRDGQIQRTLSGFNLNPRVLAWSRDGRHLATGTNGNDGPTAIHVFDTQTWKRVFLDRELRGRVDVIEFRGDGVFFAATNNPTLENEVLLYKPAGDSYTRAARRAVGRRVQTRGAWAADEKHFYIAGNGYYSGEDLTEPAWPLGGRRRPAAEGFHQVREAPGGQPYAATWLDHQASGKIRRYSDRSLRDWNEVEIPDPRVAAFAVLRNGEIAYVAQEGAVGLVGADLRLRWRNAAPVASFRGQPERFRVSADGRWVTVRTGVGRDAVELAFNLHEPRFVRADQLKTTWREPLTTRREMQLLAWSGTSNGSINGNDLPKLHVRELGLSAAVHPSEPALVYGSSFARLRKVGADGKLIWMRYLAADVTALNLIPEARLVVAATEDGYLRVLRWEDGATVLTYYLQPAERKWLVVADTGHYAAGIGAEDLAGWVVNRGGERMADFFPLSRFRERFLLEGFAAASLLARDSRVGVEKTLGRRVDEAKAVPVEAAVVPGEPEDADGRIAEALAQPAAPAVAQLPPAFEILSPGFEVTATEPRMTVRYRVTTAADAPLTALTARVVSASQATRGLLPKTVPPAAGAELSVELPAEDCEVQIVAENRWGVSEPVRIKVRWAGAPPRPRTVKGVLHVVSVGVSEYDNPDYRLGFAAKDAGDFLGLLRRQEGRMYSAVRQHVLTDKGADRAAIEAAFARLREQVAPQDTTMIFLAGHGINDGAGEYLFLPRDAQLDRLRETGLSFRRIGDQLASLPGRTVMFVDTCHSGNIVGRLRAGQGQNHAAAVNELASSEKNIVVFASSTGGQLSLEDPAWGNGAFTKALLEGIDGKADLLKRGRVTYKQLDAYVSDRVDELTQGRQTPVTPVLQGVPDFPLAEVRK